MLCTKIVLNVKTKQKQEFVYKTCSAGILSLQFSWTMNRLLYSKLLSYCGLVDAKIRASDKDLHTCSSPALTQNQSNAKNIYVSNRSYSILRWLMIIKLNLWVKKAICSVKAFAPHMCFVIRQKVMDTTVKTYLYEPFFIVILKRCLYTLESKTLFWSCILNFLHASVSG